MKKILSTLLLALCTLTCWASDMETIVSGNLGNNMTWELAFGELCIRGYGEMPDFGTKGSGDNRQTDAPWGANADDITRIVIKDGVTSVGSNAFLNLRKLRVAYLPSTLMYVGSHAFENCSSLSSMICHGEEAPMLGEDVFAGCDFITWGTLYASIFGMHSYGGSEWIMWWSMIREGKYVDGISFDKDTYTAYLGEKLRLHVTLQPEDAFYANVIYTSSDPAVGTVDENGLFTPLSEGSVTISARTTDGTFLTASCTVNVVSADFLFVDGETTIEDMSDMSVYKSISYRRNYTGQWESLFLPFSLDISAVSDKVDIARIVSVNEIDTNSDMTPDCKVLQVKVLTTGTTEPGVPYLIRAHVPGEQTFEYGSLHFDMHSLDVLTFKSISKIYSVGGTYEPYPQDDTFYTVRDGQLMPCIDDIPPFRWAFGEFYRNSDDAILATGNIVIMTSSELITSVNGISASPQAAQPIYNLQGQRLSKAPRGISIIAGRKVVN